MLSNHFYPSVCYAVLLLLIIADTDFGNGSYIYKGKGEYGLTVNTLLSTMGILLIGALESVVDQALLLTFVSCFVSSQAHIFFINHCNK